MTITLFQHQQEDLDFLASLDGAALWHVVGAGKSFPMILDAARILDAHPGEHSLILTEAALPDQVVDDWRVLAPHIPIAKLSGSMSAKEKKAVMANPPPAIVMNYEYLQPAEKWLQTLKFCHNWDDEAHRLKGFRGFRSKYGKRAKIIQRLAADIPYRRMSSGSPVVNPNNSDIWALYHLLNKEIFGVSLTAFEREFYYDVAPPGAKYKRLQLKKSMQEELSRRMYMCARRLTFDDLKEMGVEFPDRGEPMVYRPQMSTKLASQYRALEKDMMTFHEGQVITRPLILGRLMTLQQMASGFFIERPALDDLGIMRSEQPSVIHIDSSHKDRVVEEIVHSLDPSMSIIVWATFTHEIDHLCRMLGDLRPGGLARADGKCTGKKREKYLRDFKAGKIPTLVGHPAAIGAGQNMQIAGHMLRFSRSPKLVDYEQSRGRNHRAGKQFHQRIFEHEIVTPGTRDEQVHNAMVERVDLASEITLDHLKEARL
jgi:SNF2 family DNA or RNA helicase